MKTKKLLAVLMALVMVLSLGVSVLAEDDGETPTPNVPKATDTATVTVENVEAGAIVNLYQIVAPDYTTAGLTGYHPVIEGSIADIEKPTADEITTLAKEDLGDPVTATANESGDYVATVGAGMYLVLVTGSGATVYNPMIVSVNYSEDSEIVEGEVDAQTWFLQDVAVYAKSTTPEVDKTVVSTSSNDTHDVAIGDTVNFKIETTIPSYSDEYEEVVFKITDTLSAGLDDPTTVTVKVDGTEVAAGDTTYTITISDGFVINFYEDYIRAHGQDDVEVTYACVLNEDAALNFDPNTNTAKIEFTNDPSTGDTGTKEDKTYTYTFAIDGKLGGTETTETYQTHEVIKVSDDGKVEVISESTEKLDTIEVTNPLAGAVFTLTNTTTNKVYTATSDANGYLVGFTGLDAGTYTLVETTAPEGYVADTTEHTVVISAHYNDNGTLSDYTITIDGTSKSTYEATYDSTGKVTDIVASEQTTLVVKNTEIPQLPSTGGIGTTIFYIIGAVLIIGAGILLITKKRMRDR